MSTKAMLHAFTWPDFVVFGVLVFVSVAIGIFFALRDRHKNTTLNYFLGNRKQKAFPTGLSFVVTFQSSILILGFPAEAYAYGLQYAMQCIGVIAGYLLAAVIVVPVFHPLKVTSIYEYYKLRYNCNMVRYVAVTLGAIHYTFYMGIVTYGTALALESVAAVPLWASIVGFSTAAIIYTSIGGFKAVIWTDVFQSVVMLIGIIAVLIKCTVDAGGPSNVLRYGQSRINLFNFDPDPRIRHTFWTLVFGAPTQFLYLSITQAGIQRINSTPTLKSARRMFFVSAPIYSFTWILVLFQGLAIFAYYAQKRCDPLASGQVSNLNQIIPFTILELFHEYPGLPGLFIAALAAASLSTISSGLSSLAAIAYEDFIKVFWKNSQITEEIGTKISKLTVVTFGIISAGFAFMLSNVEGPLGQIMASFMGAISGPEAGLFLVSIFLHKARPRAVTIATLVGVGLVLWISIGQNFLVIIPKAPYLPLGSTDRCYVGNGNQNISHIYQNDSSLMTASYADVHKRNMSAIAFNSTTGTTMSTETDPTSGLQNMYSISYMYFNLIGTITVIVVGTVISMFSQPKVHEEKLHDHVVLPLSILVPPVIKRCFRNRTNANIEKPNNVELENMLHDGSISKC